MKGSKPYRKYPFVGGIILKSGNFIRGSIISREIYVENQEAISGKSPPLNFGFFFMEC